jgi:hypothetical protein
MPQPTTINYKGNKICVETDCYGVETFALGTIIFYTLQRIKDYIDRTQS